MEIGSPLQDSGLPIEIIRHFDQAKVFYLFVPQDGFNVVAKHYAEYVGIYLE